MKLSVMFVVISFMPQKIAVGAGIIVSLIAIFGFFPDGKCNGTVGIAFFNYPDQMDDAFICIISVFAALQDKGAESKLIPCRAAEEDLLLCEAEKTPILQMRRSAVWCLRSSGHTRTVQ